MNLAVSMSGASIIAVDRRHEMSLTTGETLFSDHGGKLVRLGQGWIAFGGDSLYAAVALEGLAGVDAGDIAAVSRSLAETASTAANVIAERWPGCPSRPADVAPDPENPDEIIRSGYLIAAEGGVAEIRYDGVVLNRGDNMSLVAYPVGYPKRERILEHDPKAVLLPTLGSMWALIRVIALEFAKVACGSSRISPDIELGVQIGAYAKYISGSSKELSQATNAELQHALREPPAPDFNTFSRYTDYCLR